MAVNKKKGSTNQPWVSQIIDWADKDIKTIVKIYLKTKRYRVWKIKENYIDNGSANGETQMRNRNLKRKILGLKSIILELIWKLAKCAH